MRIYEYAKKNKITSKELIGLLEKEGFEVASHMSVISPEALKFLDKKLALPKAKPSIKKLSDKKPAQKIVLDKKDSAKKVKSVVKKRESEPKEAVKFIIRPMVLGAFSEEIGKPSTDVILTLLKWGILCAKNQVLSQDVVKRLAAHYEVEFDHKSEKAEEKIEKFEKFQQSKKGDQQQRLPVVVVMGHVDHGKTTLLDFVRKTRVASREKGGITQHLGAYEVETPQGSIVFLDTPGHEAFSKIRMRGARAADIAILVIAADDGVMPQTVESIKHAKSVGLPIIVAINKVDRVGSEQIERVKQGLAKHELLPEDWGGDVICVPISAKLGQGIDNLLEMIVLQSQMMDLKTNKSAPAVGYVLESKIERGRGPVATLILQQGVLKIGDFFVCGKTFGKISSMVNSYGSRIESAEPSIPVLVAGLNDLPEAGDFFEVVSFQEYKKAKQGKRDRKVPAAKMAMVKGQEGFNIIIKSDSDSSREALLWAIERLSKNLEKGFNVLHSGVGDISESDIDLASVSRSLILGLHVKAEAKSLSMAQQLSVEVKFFDIIYKLIEFLQEYSESRKVVKKELKKIGEALVLRVFDIKNIGVIAGCIVKDGLFSKGGSVVAYRGSEKIGEGKIKSLQREKKTVKEVHAGFECGFISDGFSGWEVGDRVECYSEMPQDKK